MTTVALEIVLPGLGGYWLDQRFGTGFLVIVGFALGLTVGLWHLLKMTGSIARDNHNGDPPSPPSR